MLFMSCLILLVPVLWKALIVPPNISFTRFCILLSSHIFFVFFLASGDKLGDTVSEGVISRKESIGIGEGIDTCLCIGLGDKDYLDSSSISEFLLSLSSSIMAFTFLTVSSVIWFMTGHIWIKGIILFNTFALCFNSLSLISLNYRALRNKAFLNRWGNFNPSLLALNLNFCLIIYILMNFLFAI